MNMDNDMDGQFLNERRGIYVLSLAQMLAMMGMASILSLTPLYVAELGVEDRGDQALWAGIMGSGIWVGLLVFGPIWGSLADRVGRRPMVLRAFFAGAILLFAQAFVQEPYQLLILRVLQGITTGTLMATLALAASITPSSRIGLAVGITQMGSFLGGTFGPLLGGVAADTIGFRASYLIASGLVFSGFLFVLLLVQEHFEAEHSERFNLRETVTRAWHIPTDRSLLIVLFLAMLTFGVGHMVTPAIPPFVSSLGGGGNSATAAGLTLSLMGGSAALAAAIAGRLSLKFELRVILTLSCLGSALVLLPQALSNNLALTIVLLIALGLFNGSATTSLTSLVGQSAAANRQGTAYGILQSAQAIASIATSSFGGVVAATMGLRWVFVAGAIAFLLVGQRVQTLSRLDAAVEESKVTQR
jgi:DHA1 family multidrug resistance protein-like MFS transporter